MKRFLSIVLALMLLVAVVPTSAFAASATKTVYVSSTGSGTLNLRAGAGYDYDVIGYVKHNDTVTWKSVKGDWSKVTVKRTGQTGWLKTIYIDGTTKMLGTGYKAVNAAKGVKVNVYAKASSTSKVKGTITKSDTVKVTYTEDEFAYVTVTGSGLKGWILIDYVGKTVKLTPDPVPSDSKTVYTVTATHLNVRTGPGTSYRIITSIPYGTACTLIKSSGNWRKVKTMNGITGWVSRTYLTTKKYTVARVATNGSNLNVRKGPGTNSAVLGSLPNGTKVTVKYTSGNWAYITCGNLSGYCSLKWLKF